MPELPEVEIVRQSLNKKIKYKKNYISNIVVNARITRSRNCKTVFK